MLENQPAFIKPGFQKARYTFVVHIPKKIGEKKQLSDLRDPAVLVFTKVYYSHEIVGFCQGSWRIFAQRRFVLITNRQYKGVKIPVDIWTKYTCPGHSIFDNSIEFCASTSVGRTKTTIFNQTSVWLIVLCTVPRLFCFIFNDIYLCEGKYNILN